MHVLVTRPIPDAWDMQMRIERLGCKVTLAPLMEILCSDLSLSDFDGASGIVATSQNGLRSLHLAGLTDKVKRLQIYAVGEATGQLAYDMKLPNITGGRGTAESLVPVIAARQKGRPGPVVHLAGDHLAFDLKGALAKEGIEVREVEAYRSVAATKLPANVVNDIKYNQINAVTLMSPRTAAIWSELSRKHGLEDELGKLMHVCLSQAVADKLQLTSPARIEIAAAPKLDEMLVLIKGLAGQAGRE